MPSAAPSKFRGASGILRDQDGTITSLVITTENPLYTGEKPANSEFTSLWAVLGIKADGAENSSAQPVFIGDADAFSVTEDKMGLTGKGELSKSSGWFIFLNSLVNPATGKGFDEADFPEVVDENNDPIADYSVIVGARCRFNWQVNEKATKKYGMKKGKKVDPKTGKVKEYQREDLIVTNYYGQVDVTSEPEVVKKVGVRATQPAAPAVKPLGGVKGKKDTAVVDVAKIAAENIILALSAAKGKTLSKSKVSVKLLTLLSAATPELRASVRAWAEDDNNLASVEGVVFAKEPNEMLSLDTSDEV